VSGQVRCYIMEGGAIMVGRHEVRHGVKCLDTPRLIQSSSVAQGTRVTFMPLIGMPDYITVDGRSFYLPTDQEFVNAYAKAVSGIDIVPTIPAGLRRQ